jgi:hypothetical protein
MAGPLVAQSGGATGKPKGGFSRFANATARVTGKPATFIIAVLTVAIGA